MSTTCRTCIWWSADTEQPHKGRLGLALGECRRNAPRLKLERYGDGCSAAWPPTDADDWCGEHKPDLQGALDLPMKQKEP